MTTRTVRNGARVTAGLQSRATSGTRPRDELDRLVGQLAKFSTSRARMSFLRRHKEFREPAVVELLYAGVVRLARIDLQQADRLAQAAKWVAGTLDDDGCRAQSLRATGHVLFIRGKYKEALEHYHAALKIDPAYISSQYGLGNTRTLMGDFAGARQEYDRAIPMARNRMDELYVKYLKTLVYFWERQPVEGRKELAALAKEAAGKKEPNSQFQVGMAQALLTSDPQSELEQLKSLSVFLEKPLAGMNESDRGIARAAVLRERVRVLSLQGRQGDAAQPLSELETLATASKDQLVGSYFETARGYLSASKGDFENAAEGLSADPHSPLALQQLAAVEEKLGNAAAAEAARTCLKYHRNSEAEWFLATHSKASNANY